MQANKKFFNFYKLRVRITDYIFFTMGNEVVDSVQQYKYICILLNEHLKFNM